MTISCDINPVFLDKAQTEIFGILLQQLLAFNERLQNQPLFKKFQPILGVLGLSLSILAIILCIIVISLKPDWCSSSFKPIFYIPLFLAFAIFFYWFAFIDKKLKSGINKISIKNCKKLSGKCVADAKTLAPFTAEYTIKGGAISYFRVKNGAIHQVWNRKLKGVAIQCQRVTNVFKNRGSFMPMIVMPHEDA